VIGSRPFSKEFDIPHFFFMSVMSGFPTSSEVEGHLWNANTEKALCGDVALIPPARTATAVFDDEACDVMNIDALRSLVDSVVPAECVFAETLEKE
jgi:hypothetical protein